MIIAALVGVVVVVVGSIVVLAVRDRGRDRSAPRPVERQDVDRAASTGVAGYRHEAGGGPGA